MRPLSNRDFYEKISLHTVAQKNSLEEWKFHRIFIALSYRPKSAAMKKIALVEITLYALHKEILKFEECIVRKLKECLMGRWEIADKDNGKLSHHKGFRGINCITNENFFGGRHFHSPLCKCAKFKLKRLIFQLSRQFGRFWVNFGAWT